MAADRKAGWALALKLALRELRGGIRGLWVFILCLTLGVAAISAVGLVRKSIEAGLDAQGSILLGGDAKMEFTYRRASEAELAFMSEVASARSEVIDFRSMAVVNEERALTQVKAVDDHWPLLGEASFDPPMTISDALAPRDGIPSAAMDPVLIDRLGLQVGDRFKLGLQEFRLSARLTKEPDSTNAGFGLGPRTLLRSEDLAQSGLIGPGTLYDTEYRLVLRPDQSLPEVKARALEAFRDTGLRWQDSSRAAPGIERFVDRMAAFLVLVGLAGMAVGGVGISSAVRSWLEGKTATIATLRTLGAGRAMIFRVHLLQIGLLSCLAIVQGVIIGMGIPLAASPLINQVLPVPAVFFPYAGPMLEAAFYGITVALIFSVWPLARASEMRAATLFRDGTSAAGGMPRPVWWLVVGGLVLALVAGAAVFSGEALMALIAAGGIAVALLVLLLAALGLRRIARRASHLSILRGRPSLRLALAAIGAPRSEAVPVILALGLGLSTLAAIGQIESNLRGAITQELPERAPAYFMLDIQDSQIEGFLARLADDANVEKVETAPMMRGVLTRINGRPASEVAPGHWVVRGDRGITYADELPEGTKVTAGEWWPKGYAGEPLVSVAQKEADEIGLKLGDQLTVNILGRDIVAKVASFRQVDFQSGGIGFVLLLSPNAVAGAPHTHIATIYAGEAEEARLLRDLAKAYPNITAIRIREVIGQASEALSALASGTSWAAGATLLTGLIVLIGAAATGTRARTYEAAILKTLGASRGKILASFALRSGVMGAAAGVVAIIAGSVAGWAVMRFVMEVPFRFNGSSAAAIILGGIVLVLAAGLAFALGPLGTRPARRLRAKD